LDIVLVRSGIKISGKGVALSNGQMDETILVSNVDTGAKLKVRIKNSYQAEIIAKHSQ
jgi:flagella basal body P-ring formation protein FlgA